MMSRIFKPWLVLVLIFLAGAVSGAFLTVALRPHFVHPPGVQMLKHHWMEILTSKLDLKPDQQAQIEPVVADATAKLQKLHRDEMAQASQIIASVNSQIQTVLTPDQQAKLQQFESEEQLGFSGHMHSWMHQGGNPPGSDTNAPAAPTP